MFAQESIAPLICSVAMSLYDIIVKKDVITLGLSLEDAAKMAEDRDRWHELAVDMCSVKEWK